MPATAGRVRMPANNRVHSSAALQTHGIWQSAIGYDPYAPNKDETKKSSQPKAATVEPDGENAYASFQGLLALARITGSNADEARGSCKRCGRVGHLTFQCRNFLSIKDEKEKDPEAIQVAVLSGLEKLKKGARVSKTGVESSDESSDEESESSDSEYDSEIERAIAKKHGKRPSSSSSSKVKLLKKKKADSESESDEDSDSDSRRGRSKKRRSKKRSKSESDDEDDGGKKRRKDKRKRKSRKEKRRRRSHRYSSDDDSDGRRKRRSRRAADSDDDVSGPEDERSGRDRKRSERRSHKRHRD